MADKLKRLRLLALGDEDNNEQDKLLLLLQSLAVSRFTLILNNLAKQYDHEPFEEIPGGLAWIVDEVTVKRFNRIGSEGMKHQSVEGHSITFALSDFDEYTDLLDGYFDESDGKRRAGRVVFF